jgi:hypothetical protein
MQNFLLFSYIFVWFFREKTKINFSEIFAKIRKRKFSIQPYPCVQKDPYVLHYPKSNDLCDKGRLIKETFIAISHTFARYTTNPNLPFYPIPISTHPSPVTARRTLTSVVSCTKGHSLWHCERKIIWVFRVETKMHFSWDNFHEISFREICSFSQKIYAKISVFAKVSQKFCKNFPENGNFRKNFHKKEKSIKFYSDMACMVHVTW